MFGKCTKCHVYSECIKLRQTNRLICTDCDLVIKTTIQEKKCIDIRYPSLMNKPFPINQHRLPTISEE